MHFITVTPRFYIIMTGLSSLVSAIILLFEWWYYKKYGISFIEHITINYLSPLLGGADPNTSEIDDIASDDQVVPETKVWQNPLSLFRGAEYQRFQTATGLEPLTYYDMNLSAQDHQTFFTCEYDSGKTDYEAMQIAWRERDKSARISAARDVLEMSPDCAPAMILLAEEDCNTISEAEKLLRQAYKVAETNCRRSQATQYLSVANETIYRRDVNVLVYIKRRLAMCLRKLGKVREAVKMMREIIRDFPAINLFNIHENLVEALLELQAYADVQALLVKYDDINLPKSALICYTTALMKARLVADKFSPEMAIRRGLTTPEMAAVEAIHRAVEFNPHIPKYLLEMKSLILPPEHILKRGDSEGIAYAFFHLQHWKRVDGALNLLHYTWEGTFRMIPYPLERGLMFYAYPSGTEVTDRSLLPSFHDLSIYPKKDLPFYILFTGGFCSVSVLMALLTLQYPDSTTHYTRMIYNGVATLLTWVMNRFYAVLPPNIFHYLSKV
ncbi:hypothetical protein HELRODRAFT_95795 [Helobdella robusta]|uniref:Protein ST7 homolog n=1 Tax=Helobdella robusta TaxID=6412 RepID=T1G977_HELRO|nr:hypothetical protein HELRODRAFT_95795 [Helobdella robusta]ESN94641.1 hypothetical protein HELRODRAFT_95795 [Helobdella robusta]